MESFTSPLILWLLLYESKRCLVKTIRDNESHIKPLENHLLQFDEGPRSFQGIAHNLMLFAV